MADMQNSPVSQVCDAETPRVTGPRDASSAISVLVSRLTLDLCLFLDILTPPPAARALHSGFSR